MPIKKTKEKGLTLIALIVTIIVTIILAGITISAIKGNSGIISKANESKNQTERKEIIEKAKMTISEKVVDNGGNELTRNELKEILEQYFINVPEDYTLETILKTKEKNGKYEIKVSEIYNRDIMAENEETGGSTEVVPPTSSTNVENENSGNIGSGGNTGNNGNTGSSTGGTGNTNSASTSGGNSNNTENGESNLTEIDVTKVEMDKQTATVDINGENTVQLNAKVIPSNANKNTEITWTSKKKAVANVNQKGLVTGKTVGNSMIMATSQNGYSAECLVVCQAKITGIKINPVTANMIVGQKITLTATTSPKIVTEKVTWKSSNTDVAKVDRNGLVTGVGKGKAIITAQNPAGTIKATCTVTVGNATLMVATYGTGKDTDNYLRSNVVKNKIESIKFVKGQVPTAGIIEQFDASSDNDNSIIGYYTDEDSNDMYELTFVSETNIEANQNSSYLFRHLSNVKEIAFDNFDTSKVTNMGSMFYECRSLTSLDVSKFDTSQVTNMRCMFYVCESLTSLDVSKFDTSRVTDMSYMFAWCRNVTSLDVSKFNTSRVTDISGMFIWCNNVTSLDVSNFDTSKVTNMSSMFCDCRSLTSLDVSNFDTSKVTDMSGMFSSCKSLTSLDVSNFDTSRVTDMNNMFTDCEFASLDVSNFDTSRVTNMSYMFQGCEFASLDVSNFDTSRVTDMNDMFAECKFASLDVSNFDTSRVTNMYFMFNGCGNLTGLDVSNFDTSQVTNMFGMFQRCKSLTSLDVSKFDTSQVTNMAQMFWECSSLTILDVSNFDTSKVINMRSMFCDCIKLSKIYVSEYNETTGKGWTTKNVTDSDMMFTRATRLVGGNGTKFNSSYIDATYARIDKEGETGYLTDINNHITIPELAVLSQFEGEYENIDRGIVIYIMKDADGDGKIDTPDWTNKTKMQETYDQFVWVPVKNAILDLSSTYSGLDDAGIRSKVQEQINVGKYPMAIKTNTAGDYIGVLYEFSEVTENNTTYVKVTPESLWNPKSTIHREPAGLTDSKYGDTETNLKQINGILNTSYNTPTSFESALQSQYNEMVKKVEEKGGFWVGRYETSSMSNSTTENYIASNRIQVSSKRNTTDGINNVTWHKMYAQQKIYSELALENKTTSSMIWGSQYDQIMIWMKEEKSSDQAPSRGKYYVTNGVGKGNYGISGVDDRNSSEHTLASTGSQEIYSIKNIFDLAGNVYEWSLEADNTFERVLRGGSYYTITPRDTRPDHRLVSYPIDSNPSDGSRLTLY